MDFSVKRGAPRKQKTACIVVGVHAGKQLGNAATDLDRASRGALSRLVKRGDLTGKVGERLLLPDVRGIDAERVLLVGVGKRSGVKPEEYQKAVSAAAAGTAAAKVRNAVTTLTEIEVKDCDTTWKVSRQALTFAAVAYRFDQLKSKSSGTRLARVALLEVDELEQGVRGSLKQARALCGGVGHMKDLANRPGNHCTPSYLADQARELGKRHKSLKVNVLEQADMHELGMGALLSVARGSRQPPKLITLEYYGADKKDRPIVLVGKGVTFDSGGISIKPAAAMDEMKFDMSGAASVLGSVSAIAEIGPAINLVGVIPATENLPDGDASKPGDVITSMSGQTIEILNTDAEGRLILCDALTYCDRFQPDVVIDIATLTGACVIALGEHASGLMSNDDELAEALLEAGQTVGDRAWRLPLWDDYQKQIDSPFADIANVGGRSAGTITAACFLSRFTKKYRWAHIDIAGTAWTSGKNKGSTGRPVPLLVEYILSRATA